MIIVTRNLLHAVLLLILSFVGIAGVFIVLSADFVAVVQVLVYAGAIAVLMIFAVMLTPSSDRGNEGNSLQVPVLALSGLLFTFIAYVVYQTDWREAARGSFETTAADIGNALVQPFALPFEIASALLVVALVGAIVLVRED